MSIFLAGSLHGNLRQLLSAEGVAVILAALATSIPVFIGAGLYRAVLRYGGSTITRAAVTGVTVSALLVFAMIELSILESLAPQALVTYWLLSLALVVSIRNVARVAFHAYGQAVRPLEKVVIYGAGSAGAQLLAMMRAGGQFDPVAFLDDKPGLHYSQISGVSVLPPPCLGELVTDLSVHRVLLALPTVSARRRREIVASLEGVGVRVQSIPNLSDIVSGRARIDEVRDVDVADLLGRDPVPPDDSLFRSCITGKSVMVTGAGGSIGSELCRQILGLAPRRLVLFELSEFALYSIDQELRSRVVSEGLQIEIIPLLGSVHHRQRVRDAMHSCGVQTVYHAAAYKHVPLVEHNMLEGIHNNVIGTWYVAEAARDVGVETFVLISTDKAVNPANIMGASKRFAELIVQGIQSQSPVTRFSMVRFGNVLDSSGSVVPLFREQIRSGGPVTVTHPDVIRYFMTIPEAAQLVVQAGAMGQGGDVFVLDMGPPVRIDDLARRMISLMGLTVRDESRPDGDIEIKYTGLRTGEKLYEELLIGTNVKGTEHPRVMRALEHSLPWDRVLFLLEDMLIALANSDCRRALARLDAAVEEYHPKGEIEDYVWQRKCIVSPADAKVTVMPARRHQGERTTAKD